MTNKEILQQAACFGYGWLGYCADGTVEPFDELEEDGEDLIRLIRSFIGEGE